MAFLILLIVFFIYAYNMDKIVKDLQKENRDLKKKSANLADLDKVTVSETTIEQNNVELKNTETLQKLRQTIPDRNDITENKKILSEDEVLEIKRKKRKRNQKYYNTNNRVYFNCFSSNCIFNVYMEYSF